MNLSAGFLMNRSVFFAYAIINTLCYNSGFESVRFLADGAPVETF